MKDLCSMYLRSLPRTGAANKGGAVEAENSDIMKAMMQVNTSVAVNCKRVRQKKGREKKHHMISIRSRKFLDFERNQMN